MSAGPLIEHDPDEPPKDTSKAPWVSLGIILALIWAGTLYSFDVDWHSIALGVFTGAFVASWAVDVTGNKVPASWRRRPPGSRRG